MPLAYIETVKSVSKKITVANLAAVIFLFGINSDLMAQAAVRDSAPISGADTNPSSSVVAPQQTTNVDFSLINQIQQLQQEVLELRGLIEEQSFQIKRLKQQRLDDYLDLDKRISELSKDQSSAGSKSGNINPQDSGLSTLSTPVLPTTKPAAATNSEAEKTLYRKAIDQLLTQQDFVGAQESFKQYLSEYPSGTYAPNVHYWQGQIYITEGKKKPAEESFTTLVQNYPDHQKVPDAKYKLATIYYDQGKKPEAKSILEELAAGDSDASRLAKAFLTSKYK